MTSNTWKLQDAKAQFSEVVRRPRAGEPQKVTVHDKKAVAVVDLDRFEIRRKQEDSNATAKFVEMSKTYRGAPLKLPPRTRIVFREKNVFDEDAT